MMLVASAGAFCWVAEDQGAYADLVLSLQRRLNLLMFLGEEAEVYDMYFSVVSEAYDDEADLRQMMDVSQDKWKSFPNENGVLVPIDPMRPVRFADHA